MRHIPLLSLCLFCLFPVASYGADLDLSSPQATYETCYSTLELSTEKKELQNKIEKCLTHTAQKAIISYAVLGSYFIDSQKNVLGKKKHPEFRKDIDAVFEKHHFESTSRKDFKTANLAPILADIIGVYSQNDFITEKLKYSGRKMTNLKLADNTAQASEVFSLKYPFPSNTLVLSFIKVEDHWLINHISYL